MRFRLLTNDGRDEEIFGASIELENAYISAYGKLVRGKPPAELEVGESCLKEYAMSGQTPTVYKIVRVE